jgi:hypothetical protein
MKFLIKYFFLDRADKKCEHVCVRVRARARARARARVRVRVRALTPFNACSFVPRWQVSLLVAMASHSDKINTIGSLECARG